MKKVGILFLLVAFVSCFSETEQQKIDNSIMDSMYYKAKTSSTPYQSTFSADRYYRNSLNDSIVFCQQNFSYKIDYGVKKNGMVYGYFNSRSGRDVTSYVDLYVNDSEASMVKGMIR